MNILGVRIDNLSKEEILEKIEGFLSEEETCLPADKFHQIATVNPEFILRAQKDSEFKSILNKCALNVADGVGLWYAFIKNFKYLKARIAGVDLMQEILQIADKKAMHVFLAIHPGGLSSYGDIKQALNEKYPNLKVCGKNINPKKNKKWPVVMGHQIVFCNFGFPQQEKFINFLRNKQALGLQLGNSQSKIRLAMGIGGSFDFLTKKIKRAPKIMRILGLEWLWRLALEPRYRFKRVWNAFPVFAWRVLINR